MKFVTLYSETKLFVPESRKTILFTCSIRSDIEELCMPQMIRGFCGYKTSACVDDLLLKELVFVAVFCISDGYSVHHHHIFDSKVDVIIHG